MNINASLFGQMFTFLILVWVTMKYIWPPVIKALEARREEIAKGIAAAKQKIDELEIATHKSGEMIKNAKATSTKMLREAEARAQSAIDAAKEEALVKKKEIVASAAEEIQQELQKVKEHVFQEAGTMSVQFVENLLKQEISPETHHVLLNQLIRDIEAQTT